MTAALESAGTDCALGGSGMMHSLGLTESVNDWDLTTDAPMDKVLASLTAFKAAPQRVGDFPFASDYLIKVETQGKAIEIIGGFKIHAKDGVVRIPTVASHRWKGIAVGSPEVWAVAYELMNRPLKAERLWRYLDIHGANPGAVNQLESPAIPAEIRSRLRKLAEKE